MRERGSEEEHICCSFCGRVKEEEKRVAYKGEWEEGGGRGWDER